MDNTNNTPEEVTVDLAQTEAAEETASASAPAVESAPAPAVEEVKKEKVITVLTSSKKSESAPAPALAPKPAATPYAVIGSGDTDDVFLSKCIFKNAYARKSLTVHHLQRRLTELGYKHANSDKDGWYGDLTKQAVVSFQSDFGLDDSGEMNADTFAAIFDGDINVTVHLD